MTLMFRWTGAALAAAIMALPLMVRAMRLSIEGIDRRLEGAARTLGAGRWHAFRTISLPLALPGILAALVLGFARSIGEFGATITFVSNRSEEHTSELQSLMRISYAVFCLKKKNQLSKTITTHSY